MIVYLPTKETLGLITAAPSDCIPANERDLVFEVFTWPDENGYSRFNLYYLSQLNTGTMTSTFVKGDRVRYNTFTMNIDKIIKMNGENGCTIRLVSRRPKIKKPRASKRLAKIWKDNSIQFPRLIAEMDAAGAFDAVIDGRTVIEWLMQSMDLPKRKVYEIIGRASAEFEKTKVKLYEEQENGH